MSLSISSVGGNSIGGHSAGGNSGGGGGGDGGGGGGDWGVFWNKIIATFFDIKNLKIIIFITVI